MAPEPDAIGLPVTTPVDREPLAGRREVRRWPLAAVLLIHLAMGAAAPRLSAQLRPSYQLFLLLAVTISQGGLLSVLAGLAPAQRMERLVWLAIGCGYLASLTDQFLPASVPMAGRATYIALVLAPVVLVSFVLSLLRFRAQIAPVGADPRNDARPGLQFSVKHYLALNVVLGLLLVVRPAALEPTMANSLVLAAIIAVCATALILGAAWASLSPGRPWPRILVVLLLAMLTGFLPPYYFRMSAADQAAFVVPSLLQALVMMGTLLVIRLAGYRLVDPRHSTIVGR